MQARDIERHLTQLGQELTDRGIQKPIRVLMIGGAYMLLLAKMQRSTDDVDILWLDEDDAFQRGIDELREGVQAVAEKQRLEPDWFNESAAFLHVPSEGTWRNAALLVWGLG
jgi:Nucleotidyltransferase of unknown function (DUF6036)